MQKCKVGRGEFYVTEEQFHKGQNIRRKRMIEEYLKELTPAEADQLLLDCDRDMRDLGMDPTKINNPHGLK